MGVPIAIFVVCFAAAVYASSRWLPDLAPDRLGAIAFFAVCGLLGGAAAVFGLDVYGIVENLSESPFGRSGRARLLADGLESLLWQTGVLIALALGVYFLAPPREDDAGSLASGPEQGSRSA